MLRSSDSKLRKEELFRIFRLIMWRKSTERGGVVTRRSVVLKRTVFFFWNTEEPQKRLSVSQEPVCFRTALLCCLFRFLALKERTALLFFVVSFAFLLWKKKPLGETLKNRSVVQRRGVVQRREDFCKQWTKWAFLFFYFIWTNSRPKLRVCFFSFVRRKSSESFFSS